MPALPSGQHVAVDPAPLNKLLLESNSPFNAHHVMAIEQADDLLRWFDVLLLKRADALTVEERSGARAVPGAPADLVGVVVGRLSDYGTIASEWSAADRAVFESFFAERIEPAMQRQMVAVRDTQEALRKSPTLAGAFAAMWRGGVHPLQVDPDD